MDHQDWNIQLQESHFRSNRRIIIRSFKASRLIDFYFFFSKTDCGAKMDPFAELERMALNAQPEADSNEPSEGEITRWQQLFYYSRPEAADLIQEHRSNISRQ